ncbi:beta-1,4-xylosyltransferase IRX14-like [Bidens hawaiensis]|uniref:beta-1,4-xylosyltransferase IRX14-like n=1 Tax=Bidens hawaiensis TaxID=980011 RepID=UPI00404953CC
MSNIQSYFNHTTMKFQLLHQSRGRSNSLPADDEGVTKSPVTIFWTILHCLCCLISLILGFRFSRLIFFLLFSNVYINNFYTTTLTTSFAVNVNITQTVNKTVTGNSRVVVGRHGIRVRPWPHPNPEEVMKAHNIIKTVQREQKVQYGIKNPRTLIVVTPTYVRTFQAFHLTGLMHTLMNLPYDVVWIVVEAGGATNETMVLLERTKSKANLQVKHVGFEKNMSSFWNARHKLESEMRLQALRVVREEKLDGIVMFADDSNMHSLELFDEVQKVEWIGAVSVGIHVHSSHSDATDEKKSPLLVQGPVCNLSDKLTGWHAVDSSAYQQKSADYIGDMAIVLPQEVEWCGFVMNSRLVWEESEFRPEWIKDLDMVVDGFEGIESPLSFVEESSMVEPLGGCGKKVMVWWLRAEARADSKFPSGWTVDPRLEATAAAKRTLWLDAVPELVSNTENVLTTSILENGGQTTRTR